MLQAGTGAVSQQLAEMAIGIHKNFDIAAIASAILTAGISQKLDKLQPILRTRVSPVLGITLNALLEGGKINVESLAAQALGAMAAQEVSMRLQNTLEAQKQKLASYAKGQKAGQGVGGTSSSDARGYGNKTDPAAEVRSKQKTPYKTQTNNKEWGSYLDDQASDILTEMVNQDFNPKINTVNLNKFDNDLANLRKVHPDLIQGVNKYNWIDKNTGNVYIYSKVNGVNTFRLVHDSSVVPLDIDKQLLEFALPGGIGIKMIDSLMAVKTAARYLPTVVDELEGSFQHFGFFKPTNKSVGFRDNINLSEVYYSQETISFTTREGVPIPVMADSMKANGWDLNKGKVDIISRPQGGYVSLDNRRIVSANWAGLEEIPANVYGYNQLLPNEFLESKRYESFQSPVSFT